MTLLRKSGRITEGGKAGELFGDRVKELREVRGITKAQLARLIDESEVNVGRYERTSKTLPGPVVVRRLAAALGTTPQDLVRHAGYWDEDEIYGAVDDRIVAACRSVPDDRQKEFIAAVEVAARLARGA